MTPFDEMLMAMQGPWYRPVVALSVLLAASLGIGILCFTKALPQVAPRNRALAYFAAVTFGMDALAILFLLFHTVIFQVPAWVLLFLLLPFGVYGVARLTAKDSGVKFLPLSLSLTWLIVLGLPLGAALLLPYSWDEQSYQIALAYRYLESGSIAVVSDNPYSALSSMPHFLFLWGVKTGGLNFPRLLIWSCYALAIPFLFLLLRPYGKRSAGVLTAVFVASPLVAGMWREVYLEPFILLNLMAGVAALRTFRLLPRHALAAAGAAAGMAVAVKMTGAAAGIALAGFAMTFLSMRHAEGGVRWRSGIGWFLAAALVFALPFYLRPWLATGNPFYPFGSMWLSPQSAAALVEGYHMQLGVNRFGLGPVLGFFAGWILVAFRMEIFDGYVTGWQFPVMIVAGTVGWLWLRRVRPRAVKPYWWSVAGGLGCYLFWSLSAQQSRFLLPLWFPVALWAASGLRALPRRWRVFGLSCVILAAVVSFELAPWTNFYYAWRSMELSRKAPAEMLIFATRESGYVGAMRYLAEHTAPDAVILLLFDRRTLYMPRRALLGTPFFQERFFTPPEMTSDEAYRVLRENGIDYILAPRMGYTLKNPDPQPEYDAMNVPLVQNLLALHSQGRVVRLEMPGAPDYTLFQVE